MDEEEFAANLRKIADLLVSALMARMDETEEPEEEVTMMVKTSGECVRVTLKVEILSADDLAEQAVVGALTKD